MDSVLLPAKIPQFTTYQCDACPAIVMAGNPTADNWYFNNGFSIRRVTETLSYLLSNPVIHK